MWTNSVYAMFSEFSDNYQGYNWAFGLAELEALEEHVDSPKLQAWHDALVGLFYYHHRENTETIDYVIIP